MSGPKSRFTRAQVEKVLELCKDGKSVRAIVQEMKVYHDCPISGKTIYRWRDGQAPWLRERFGQELQAHWELKRLRMAEVKTATEDKKWELATIIMDALTHYIHADLLGLDKATGADGDGPPTIVVTAEGAKELRKTLDCIAKILPEQKVTGKFEAKITQRYEALIGVITEALPAGLPGGPGIYAALRSGVSEDTRPGVGEPHPLPVQLDAAGVAAGDRSVPRGKEAGAVHHIESTEVRVLDSDSG